MKTKKYHYKKGVTFNSFLLATVGLLFLVLIILMVILFFKKGWQFKPKQLERSPLTKTESLIRMTEKGFNLKTKLVNRLDVVIVRNDDKSPHEISSTYPRFKTRTLPPKSEFSFAAITPGKWELKMDNKHVLIIEVKTK